METVTVLLLLAAATLAAGIVLFQYRSKSHKDANIPWALIIMRFIALYGILVLLVNPKFTKKEYSLEKTELIVLRDNSMSLRNSGDTLKSITDAISRNGDLMERFRLRTYNFGTSLKKSDSLTFDEKYTDIGKALTYLKDIYASSSKNMAVLMATDGNQTIGKDYSFVLEEEGIPVFPIVIGDTTRYEDLRIDRVNANTFAFLKNQYPVETYLTYEGGKAIESTFKIKVNGKTVYTENIRFTPLDNTKVISALLTADTVGTKTVETSLSPLEGERNVLNNKRHMGLEVVDERTNVSLISAVRHPDIGALKKAIESNEQRTVSIKKPSVSIAELEDTDIFILYGPDARFRPIYEYLQERKANYFTICSIGSDWSFLNEVQDSYVKDPYGEEEELLPVLNKGFGIFDITDFSVQNFPPLHGDLGEIQINTVHEVLLGQSIKGVELGEPLLALIQKDRAKEAVLFGENVWKWRMQSYRDDAHFGNFDDTIGKIMLYLSSNNTRSRLDIQYDPIYEGSGEVRILARYFDEAYELDRNAELTLTINGDNNAQKQEIPMLFKNNNYLTDLSDLPAGSYNFTVKVLDENITSSGSFSILDFNVEQQFLSSDFQKLDQLARRSGGQTFFPSDSDNLIRELLEDPRFSPVQKSKENVVSLIDFRILLLAIIGALAAEWFIRKYNGLI